MIKLAVFDLDGTLADSKRPIDAEMASLLAGLLDIIGVAIISGGAWQQFEMQVLAKLSPGCRLRHLSLLPTCGTQFHQFDGTWRELYAENFNAVEKARIISSMTEAFDLSGFKPSNFWGEAIEDRGSQITLSALGQNAPLEEKANWDPAFEKRVEICRILRPLIPEFSIHIGGATSIDVNRPGVDKAYGVRKLAAILATPMPNMIFMGDALFPGGNDYPVKLAGVTAIRVRDPQETKRVIETIIACH